MNTKEFVNKIISTSQNQILQRIRSLPKLLSVSFISALALLPHISIPNRGVLAYTQQVQLQTITDPWYQSLEIARMKLQAALSPGAFGHGVPSLHNLTTNEILMAFGVSVLAGMATFMIVRALSSHMNRTKISRVFLQNKMI